MVQCEALQDSPPSTEHLGSNVQQCSSFISHCHPINIGVNMAAWVRTFGFYPILPIMVTQILMAKNIENLPSLGFRGVLYPMYFAI